MRFLSYFLKRLAEAHIDKGTQKTMTNEEKLTNVKACIYKIASDTSLDADVEHDLTEEKLTWMLFVLQQLEASSTAMTSIVTWKKKEKTISEQTVATVKYDIISDGNTFLTGLSLASNVESYYYETLKTAQDPYIPLTTISTMYSTYGQYSTWKLAQEIRTTYATAINALPSEN